MQALCKLTINRVVIIKAVFVNHKDIAGNTKSYTEPQFKEFLEMVESPFNGLYSYRMITWI